MSKYEFNFGIGDDLWYFMKEKTGDEERPLIKVRKEPCGIAEILISNEGVKVSNGDGNFDKIGTQYAFLTEEDAFEYVSQNFPKAFVLGLSDAPIDVVVCYPGTDSRIESIKPTFGRIKQLLDAVEIKSMSTDKNGLIGYIDANAKKEDKPFNRLIFDEDGNIVDVAFGTLIVLQTTMSKEGFLTFTSVNEKILDDVNPAQVVEDLASFDNADAEDNEEDNDE